MKIEQIDIDFVKYICEKLPKLLNQINDESKCEHYIYQSPNRAEFERLRVELNKKLMEIKRVIYK